MNQDFLWRIAADHFRHEELEPKFSCYSLGYQEHDAMVIA